jgi:hypothetical protein
MLIIGRYEMSSKLRKVSLASCRHNLQIRRRLKASEKQQHILVIDEHSCILCLLFFAIYNTLLLYTNTMTNEETIITRNEISPHLDVIIGGRYSGGHKKTQDTEIFLHETVQQWLEDYKNAKQYERRQMIPLIAQQLIAGGCRFIKAAQERTSKGKVQYVRTHDTRKIHAKVARVIKQAVKESMQQNKSRPVQVFPAFSTPSASPLVVQSRSKEQNDSPVSPSLPSTSILLAPSIPSPPLLTRELSLAAPFLARNTSLFSVMSSTHSVDCLIGTMLSDGIFGDSKKTTIRMGESGTDGTGANNNKKKPPVEPNLLLDATTANDDGELTGQDIHVDTGVPMESWSTDDLNKSFDYLSASQFMTEEDVVLDQDDHNKDEEQDAEMVTGEDADDMITIANTPTVIYDLHSPKQHRTVSATSSRASPSSDSLMSEVTEEHHRHPTTSITAQDFPHLATPALQGWMDRMTRLEQTVNSLLSDNENLRQQLEEQTLQTKRLEQRLMVEEDAMEVTTTASEENQEQQAVDNDQSAKIA